MSPSPSGCPEGTFHDCVAGTIDTYGLLKDGDRVLVAVSGGPDSVALLHALCALRARYAITLAVAHLNHGLRDAAGDEQAFVAQLAQTLALPFHTTHEDVREYQDRHKLSLEDAGRRVRYSYLKGEAKRQRCTKIAIGHHADDTAELVLMNLLRGSGPMGMAGIAPRQGHLIRPLIDIHRDRITAYLNARKLAYHHDESNHDRTFLRNRIRHELIPRLESEFNPSLRQTLQRTARILRDEEIWIDQHLRTAYESLQPIPQADGVGIAAPPFRAAPPALQRRILRQGLALVASDLKQFNFDHIEQIRLIALGNHFPKWLDLPRGVRVRVGAGKITLQTESVEERQQRRQGNKLPPGYRYTIDAPEASVVRITIPEINARFTFSKVTHPEGGIPKPDGPGQAYFDLDSLHFPLTIRAIQPGDRFMPLGMKGHQKVSDLLIDRKIRSDMRLRIPVLVSGDQIVWVAGVRTDHSARIRKRTHRLLVGDFCLLK